MSEDADHRTSPTLIGRVQADPHDHSAWVEFERRYSDSIRGWCRRWGLQSSDADDLTQDVLLAVSKQMERFEYDRSRRFRGWLKTIAHRAWCDFLDTQRRRAVASGETAIMELLEQQGAEDDFADHIEHEWRRELLEQALESVEGRVQGHTWEAFRLLTREGLSGAEVAERLDMQVGAVWVAASKVRKMIRQEVRRMESVEHPGGSAR